MNAGLMGDGVEATIISQLRCGVNQCLRLEGCIEPYYLKDPSPISLVILVWAEGLDVSWVSVFSPELPLKHPVPDGLFTTASSMRAWCEANAIACFDLRAPLRLSPISILKPWGCEVWYTGVEARGQSALSDAVGNTLPLPWLMELFPQRLSAGKHRDITLLKILAPLAEPVYGDLYFEMHEQKQEVYVVSAIDQQAWPNGQGGMRFGFCQAKRAEFSSDAAFRSAYLTSVKNYEAVRRDIDKIFDANRALEGITLNEPVTAAQTRKWQAELPVDLQSSERRLREAVDSFSFIKPLAVGDVVKVPCFTPHSLLHGVTTVEFQTPVYERKILSFAQKVLTQSHWDTAAAMAKVSLEQPELDVFPILERQQNLQREEIVRFDSFVVERVRLEAGASLVLDLHASYGLLMTVVGEVSVDEVAILPMQACLVPANKKRVDVKNSGQSAVLFLYSYPT